MAADDTTVYVPLSDLSFGTDMMAGKPSPAAGGGLFAYRFADGTRLWHAPAISLRRVVPTARPPSRRR